MSPSKSLTSLGRRQAQGKRGKRSLLYVVRHGDTDLNAEGRFRGFVDVPLNELGREQAEAIKEFLAGRQFAHCYSSDLRRAIETALIILGNDAVIEYTVSIRPWNIGKFAGKPKDAKNRAALKAYADAPDTVVPGGESLSGFRSRFEDFFCRCIEKAEETGQPAITFTHASDSHEVGNIVYGSIDAVDVSPGGVVEVFGDGEQLGARIIFESAPPRSKSAPHRLSGGEAS